MGLIRLCRASATADWRLRPSRSAIRVWCTSRMALLTTSPSRMTKPMMVKRSIGKGTSRPLRCSASTPPTVASGRVSSTRMASLREAKTPHSRISSIMMANRKMPPRLSSACCRLSALPATCSSPPAGNSGRMAAKLLVCKVSSTCSMLMPAGGSINSWMLRRPSARKMLAGPRLCSTRSSSPSGTMRPDGVASGTALSSSGLAELCPISRMSSRSSPSKYSPTRRPSPKVWMMVGMGVRSQPTSARRLSCGTSRSSGAVKSSPGSGLIWAPGKSRCTMAMLSRAAR
ncbi:hypothetical protein D3C78_1070050 [compost metagenome]